MTVVAVRGRLDLGGLPALRERLLHVPFRPGSLLVVEMSGVTDCGAAGLAPLVAAARRARFHGGDLRLAAPSPAVVNALRTSGLGRLLPVLVRGDSAAGLPAVGEPRRGAHAAA
ncbi:STAS domain-containing protein [Streptomyces sp. MST-110588]|nr:STAS domain-containing protein [Streptomyces sp. MST-110588]